MDKSMLTETPMWDDCKVAYGIDDERPIWRHENKWKLPIGWSLCETDCSGARCIAVFRVDVIPTAKDGETVIKVLRRIKAILPATI